MGVGEQSGLLTRRGALLAWTAHLGVWALGASWAGVSHWTRLRRLQLPLQPQPWPIRSLVDEPLVISDDQLLQVLKKLELEDQGPRLRINHVDHALRFLGREHRPSGPGYLSGQQMVKLLTDHRRFVARYGPAAPPLLESTRWGVRVVFQNGRPTASSHRDHTVATLAEVGLGLQWPIYTPAGPASMEDLVRHVLLSFELDQREYEWSALVAGMFLAPRREWFNRWGRRISFDMLAGRIMRERMPLGVCYGNHRLYTLAALLQLDQQHRLFSPTVRKQATRFLRQMSRRLVRHQHPQGFWNGDWPWRRPQRTQPATEGTTDRLQDRIVATGHALEWLAIAPAEVLPPREVVVRAGQYLAQVILQLGPRRVQQWYTYLSHAGRALALWRGKLPQEVLG